MPIRFSGPEFLVNTTTAQTQNNSAIAVLPDGRIIISWTDRSQSGGDTSDSAIRARIFNADGSPSVAEFLVNSTVFRAQDHSRISMLADGRFVIIWSDSSVIGNQDVRARIFNADGTQSVPEFIVNSTATGDQFGATITLLADGRFVASWTDAQSPSGSSSWDVRARIFNADGTQSVPEFLVNSNTINGQSNNAITALPDGRFVASWHDFLLNGDVAVRLRIFNADGSQSVPEISVGAMISPNQTHSVIAALADGRIVVSWTDGSLFASGDGSGQAIKACILNGDGSLSVPTFLVNATTTGSQNESRIAVLADGRFVISWTDDGQNAGDSSGFAVRARLFNPDGTPAMAEFVVATTTASDQRNSAITALADGRFAISWDDASQTGGDASSGSIRAQIFDPTRFDGGNADDVVVGGSLADSYFGGGGNDTLSGMGGGDILDGGSGVSTLNGGAGDDRLLLGSGASGSAIDGGLDTDTLVINGSVNALAILAGIEALELSGGANLTLTGSQFSNGLSPTTALIGNGNLTVNMTQGVAMQASGMTAQTGSTIAFNVNGTAITDIIKASMTATNTINGGDGNDQIRGGNLADVINGGNANDKIMALGGADTLTGGAGADQFRYIYTTDSGLGANADHITDFLAGTDKLDFRALDADPVAAGRQALTFINTQAFNATGAAEARYVTSGVNLLVEVDFNGDGIADMQIVLDNASAQTLTAGDFLL